MRQAAERVLAELRKVRPDAILLDPDTLVTEYATLGTSHVICVGQWADNPVMRMTWGHWASSKARRNWQTKGEARAIELMGLWEKDIPAQPWRDRHDFFAFGYGELDGPDVGYVQTVRNPFPILLRTVPGQKQYDRTKIRINDRHPYNQMYFMVHLTGTGPAGVVKAVEAFLGPGLLNGIIPGAAKPLLGEWNLEGLGPKQLATDLPAWVPTAGLPEGVQYLGQQMPGSHLYGGFTEASGQRPLRCWRLKYSVPGGFVLYDSYPTNRASGNELFVAELSDAAAANTAAKALRRAMGSESQETTTWELGGHRYALYAGNIKNRRTWSEARTFCEQRGGHLITLGSKEEQNALGRTMLKTRTKIVFIGLTGDWRTNAWAWVTGEPVSFRGWEIKNGKEVYGPYVEDLPPGQYPVLFTQEPKRASKRPKPGKKSKPDSGWFLADADHQADTGYFVCEWDGRRPASKPTQRVSTRDRFVVMQSFALDDPAGGILLRKAVER
ncbi:MAG: C-type lectin domain-containing protein [Phycisphaerae bacterium]